MSLIKLLHVSAYLNHFQGVTQNDRASKLYAVRDYLNSKCKSETKFKFKKKMFILNTRVSQIKTLNL